MSSLKGWPVKPSCFLTYKLEILEYAKNNAVEPACRIVDGDVGSEHDKRRCARPQPPQCRNCCGCYSRRRGPRGELATSPPPISSSLWWVSTEMAWRFQPGAACDVLSAPTRLLPPERSDRPQVDTPVLSIRGTPNMSIKRIFIGCAAVLLTTLSASAATTSSAQQIIKTDQVVNMHAMDFVDGNLTPKQFVQL